MVYKWIGISLLLFFLIILISITILLFYCKGKKNESYASMNSLGDKHKYFRDLYVQSRFTLPKQQEQEEEEGKRKYGTTHRYVRHHTKHNFLARKNVQQSQQ